MRRRDLDLGEAAQGSQGLGLSEPPITCCWIARVALTVHNHHTHRQTDRRFVLSFLPVSSCFLTTPPLCIDTYMYYVDEKKKRLLVAFNALSLQFDHPLLPRRPDFDTTSSESSVQGL